MPKIRINTGQHPWHWGALIWAWRYAMVKATVKGMLTPEQMVAARLMPGRGVALVRPNGQNVDFPNPGGKRLDEFGLYIAPNGARYGYFPHQKLYAGPTMDGFLRTTWRQQTIPPRGKR